MPASVGQSALIVGAGSGLSAALARALHRLGVRTALAARNTGKLAPLVQENRRARHCVRRDPPRGR